MYFIILGILQNFIPKMLQIAFPGLYISNFLRKSRNWSHAIAVLFAPSPPKMQHELHLWIYYMSKFLNTSEFIIMINSRHILNLSIELIIKSQALDKTSCYKCNGTKREAGRAGVGRSSRFSKK
jgi:hypothetical protein